MKEDTMEGRKEGTNEEKVQRKDGTKEGRYTFEGTFQVFRINLLDEAICESQTSHHCRKEGGKEGGREGTNHIRYIGQARPVGRWGGDWGRGGRAGHG
jgi:hypothetical protein